MSKTNFEKVVDFNRTFGVPTSKSVQHETFVKTPALVKLRMDLIREEMRELEDAVKNHDMVETIDALADLIYVVYGMGASLGVDLDKAVAIVHASNMSKLCDTEEDAKETVRRYAEDTRYDSPYYTETPHGKFIVKNRSTGKVLKSFKYTPADFESLI